MSAKLLGYRANNRDKLISANVFLILVYSLKDD